MSAKHSKRKAHAPTPAGRALATASPAPAPSESAEPSWLESSDPRKRMWGKIVLVALWLYVAALCLLALDQWFRWGIFGPKVPLLP